MASISKESHDYADDLLLSLFMVAVNSYRYDSVLRPFPQSYLNPDTKEKDIGRLRLVARNIPPVKEMSSATKVSPDVQSLYKWVTETPAFKLVHEGPDQFGEILKLTEQEGKTSYPNHIFKVVYSDEREKKFLSLKNGHKILYAYHGSSLENFHSILHNGLAWHLNKNDLFGPGTYLSSELSVSLHYSYGHTGWSGSSLGPKLSCVAVCELIDDSSSSLHRLANGRSKYLSQVDSLGGKLPEKYYLVQNNDLVLVRYLLVYTYGGAFHRQNSMHWWRKHRMLVFCLSYAFILVGIGLSRWWTNFVTLISSFFQR